MDSDLLLNILIVIFRLLDAVDYLAIVNTQNRAILISSKRFIILEFPRDFRAQQPIFGDFTII